MPAPVSVRLEHYDPAWPSAAEHEALALRAALGPLLIAVHHIGSTSVPGMSAKPILDLLLIVSSVDALDKYRSRLERLGYKYWGEYGLAGRRYCTRSDPQSGRRIVQLHCWTAASHEIVRHLAFRDYLRGDPARASAYAAEKARCQALHPEDSHAYGDCKSAWIRTAEANALAARG